VPRGVSHPVRASAARYGWEYAQVRHYGPGDSLSPLAAPETPVSVSDLLP